MATCPLAYPLVPRYENAGIRRRAFQNYLIFYRVTSARVEIIRILHAARDIDRILFPT